ncbi:NAD(P)-binding domain-containing protein [Vermiphilus pyriformis]|nr:MAG: NAD(P)-binding domain-containing protein [Vermiphilus pyriformis]
MQSLSGLLFSRSVGSMSAWNSLLCIISLLATLLHVTPEHSKDKIVHIEPNLNKIYSWTIIGAGPAGIVTLGLLLEQGIQACDILWIDQYFNVGDLGRYYKQVPGNTPTQSFIEFIQCCSAFRECASPAIDRLYTYDLHTTYPLHIIIEPLQDITYHLLKKVPGLKGHVRTIDYKQNEKSFDITTCNGVYRSSNVILATGCHPRTLNYPCKDVIPLEIALDSKALEKTISKRDTIAVVGSSHSAVLTLKNLCDISASRIINLYKQQIKTFLDTDGSTIVGTRPQEPLGGQTAAWAQQTLLGTCPAHLIRLYNNKEARNAWLPICTKIIYAIGFDRNIIRVDGQPVTSYDDHTGVIAPGLFGIGIAFPERIDDSESYKIGLYDFMEYAQKTVPLWAMRRFNHCAKFDELFNIVQL